MGKIATILLAVAVVAAPVAVGSVHATVVAALLVVLLVASGLSLASREAEDANTWLSTVAAACGLLAGWSALQLVPVPVAVLEVLQWEGARIWREGWSLAFESEAPWRPLTMDAAATADRGLRWTVLGLASWTAANLPSARRWRSIYRSVLIAGVVTLAVGATSRALDPTTFFGIYEPTIPFRGPSPFVSTNHAASFYGLCGLVGLGGLAMRREEHPVEASVSGVLGLLFLALAAVHDSDAVMAALGLSVVVFVVGFVVRSSRGSALREQIKSHAGRLLAGLVSTTCVFLIAWWIGALESIQKLVLSPLEGSESALNRSEIMSAALRASTDYPLVGAGGGAVDVTVGRYVDWTALRPASIPVVENDPVEWLLTYGWLAGGVAIALFCLAAALAARRLSKPSRGERWILASALFVFGGCVSLFHFPYFALGVSLPLLVAIEGMTSPRKPAEPRELSWSGHIGVSRVASWIGLVVVGLAGGAFFALHQANQVEFDAEPAELVAARPSDGRVFAELAARSLEEDPARAVELARWSAELDAAPDAKVFLARTLGRADQDEESAQVYRDLLASPVEAGLVRAGWLVQDLERAEDRATALSKADGRRIQQVVRAIGRAEGPPAATDTILIVAETRNDDPAVHRAAVDTFMALGAFDLAELWAQSVSQRKIAEDGTPIGPELLAQVALAQKKNEEARRIAREALAQEDPGERLAIVYLTILPDVVEADDAEAEAVARATEIACVSPVPKGRRKLCWLAKAWSAERAGAHDEATIILQRIASRLDAPQFLAHFWRRRGRCLELQRLVEEQPSDALRKSIQRVAAQCRSGSDKLTPQKGR